MPEVHESAKRLYSAAKEVRGVVGQSAVARLLNVAPQLMLNWERRGVSQEGALNAQMVLGCDANWILLRAPDCGSDKKLRSPSPQLWPFHQFTADDFYMLNPRIQREIEDWILGALNRQKQRDSK